MSAWFLHPASQLGSLALLWVALLTPPCLEAAESTSQVNIQATLGFADTFRLGYWAPLAVTVSNRGNHLLGELQVRLTYGDVLKEEVFTKTHRRSLDIAGNSRKRLRFTVFVEAFTVPLEIRIVSGGRELARHSIDLRRKFTEARLVLVLSRDANLDYLNDSSGKHLRVLYPHPQLLPDHWQGYDGVAAVIVHGVSLENLGRRQFDALRKWLAQGGRLAVAGGPDYSLLRSPRLAELLPATPAGLLTVTDATELGRALGEPLATGAPFHIHRLAAIRGQVLYRAGDLPLVVEQANGRGSVAYLSFDIAGPPFDRWAGMRRLWSTVLRIPEQHQPFEQRVLRRASPVPAVLERRAGGFASHGILLVFLILYLGMLATLYHLQPITRTGRRILPSLLLASPLLFAAAAYFLFGRLLFPAGATVVVASVIEPFPAGPYARLSLDLGMFTTQRRQLQLDFAATEPVFLANHRERRWGTTASYSVDESAGRLLETVHPRSYVLHLLQAEDVIAYDVDVSAFRTPSGIRLSVRNNTGQSWLDAWLVSGRSLFRLGAVDHNDGAALALDAGAAQFDFADEPLRFAFTDLKVPPDHEPYMTRTLLASVLGERVKTLGRDEALLAAIAPSPLRFGDTNASWQQQMLTLVLVRIQIAGAVHDNVTG